MAKVDTKGQNTQMMRMHRMKQSKEVAGKIEEVDLGATDIILFSSSNALNAEAPRKLPLIMRPNPEDHYISSDPEVDEQLMFKIAFRDPVSLTHLLIRATRGPNQPKPSITTIATNTNPNTNTSNDTTDNNKETDTTEEKKEETEDENEDNNNNEETQESEDESGDEEEESSDEEDKYNASGPRMIKLFANKPEIDFTDASDLPASQQIVLNESDLTGHKITLKSLKFQRVSSISIFIVDNQHDTNVTFLNRIGLIGRIAKSYHTSYT